VFKEAHHNVTDAEAFFQKAQESQQRAKLVRQAVMNHEHLSKGKLQPAAEETVNKET
jgi:hypothetical protein